MLIEKQKKKIHAVCIGPIENKFLIKVNSIIEDNLDNPEFTVPFLCRELALSRPQLYRKISILTGKSILGYINFYRLNSALKLIRQDDYTCKEIAYKVGFSDNHYFSRSFKKEFGSPPSCYQSK